MKPKQVLLLFFLLLCLPFALAQGAEEISLFTPNLLLFIIFIAFGGLLNLAAFIWIMYDIVVKSDNSGSWKFKWLLICFLFSMVGMGLIGLIVYVLIGRKKKIPVPGSESQPQPAAKAVQLEAGLPAQPKQEFGQPELAKPVVEKAMPEPVIVKPVEAKKQAVPKEPEPLPPKIELPEMAKPVPEPEPIKLVSKPEPAKPVSPLPSIEKPKPKGLSSVLPSLFKPKPVPQKPKPPKLGPVPQAPVMPEAKPAEPLPEKPIISKPITAKPIAVPSAAAGKEDVIIRVKLVTALEKELGSDVDINIKKLERTAEGWSAESILNGKSINFRLKADGSIIDYTEAKQ